MCKKHARNGRAGMQSRRVTSAARPRITSTRRAFPADLIRKDICHATPCHDGSTAPMASEDYRTNRDPAMDAIMEYLQARDTASN